MKDLGDQITAVLEELPDPQSQKTLGKLGMIGGVDVDDGGSVVVKVRLTTPNYRKREELAAAVRQAALGVDGVKGVSLQFAFQPDGRNVTPDDAVPEVKNVVLVMSGKGGVGKSTVAVNLAVALRKMGATVGLLDADIHGPSIPTMLGSPSALMGDGKKIMPHESLGVKLMSIGYLLEDEKSAVIWRGPMLHGALVQFLKDVAWGSLDYLLLDLPPGTGDIALTLSQRVRCNGAVVVTTPQKVALQDVYKAVSMNQKLGIPVLGVVENQAYFVCKHGERYDLFGQGGGAEVARLAGAPLLGQIPIYPEIRECGDSGTPVVEAAPESPAAQAFLAIATQLADRIAKENATGGGRLTTMSDDEGRQHLPVMR